jgi:hypothetical protein
MRRHLLPARSLATLLLSAALAWQPAAMALHAAAPAATMAGMAHRHPPHHAPRPGDRRDDPCCALCIAGCTVAAGPAPVTGVVALPASRGDGSRPPRRDPIAPSGAPLLPFAQAPPPLLS